MSCLAKHVMSHSSEDRSSSTSTTQLQSRGTALKELGLCRQAKQPGEHDKAHLALRGHGCREAPAAGLSLSSSLAKLRHEKVKFAWMTNVCH